MRVQKMANVVHIQPIVDEEFSYFNDFSKYEKLERALARALKNFKKLFPMVSFTVHKKKIFHLEEILKDELVIQNVRVTDENEKTTFLQDADIVVVPHPKKLQGVPREYNSIVLAILSKDTDTVLGRAEIGGNNAWISVRAFTEKNDPAVTILHELLHLFGARHEKNVRSIMYPFTSGRKAILNERNMRTVAKNICTRFKNPPT